MRGGGGTHTHRYEVESRRWGKGYEGCGVCVCVCVCVYVCGAREWRGNSLCEKWRVEKRAVNGEKRVTVVKGKKRSEEREREGEGGAFFLRKEGYPLSERFATNNE